MSDIISSYVYAVHAGMDFRNETVDFCTYDDCSGLLLCIKGSVLFAYQLPTTFQPDASGTLRWTYPLEYGPLPRCIRCSTDGKILALQHSDMVLEFMDLDLGNMFVHSSSKGSIVLGMCFTECTGSEIVLVTNRGLEMCAFTARRSGLVLRLKEKLQISFYEYTHETRILMVGNVQGSKCILTSWQFLASGITPLPSFNLTIPPPPSIPSSSTPPSLNTHIPWPKVRLAKLYGHAYCCHVDDVQQELVLYRFYTDAMSWRRAVPLLSPHVDVSVVDNVLVIHYTSLGCAMLLDIALEPLQPLTQPLPVALLQPAVSAGQHAQALNTASLSFIMPNLALDLSTHQLYKLYLDVAAVSPCCSDPIPLVGFLQRRQPAPSPQMSAMLKQLLKDTVVRVLQERHTMPRIRAMLDDMVGVHKQASLSQATPSAALRPEDMVELLRGMLADEHADVAYLQAALLQYQASMLSLTGDIPAVVKQMNIDVMLENNQIFQVQQQVFLQDPKSRGALVSYLHRKKSLSADPAGIKATLPVTEDDAATSAVEEHVRALLQEGHVVRAMRFAQLNARHQLSVSPQEYLEAAVATGRMSVLMCVYRNFKELTATYPTFESLRGCLETQ